MVWITYLKFTCPETRRHIVKNNIMDRMMIAVIIATLSSAGISIAADGQREPQEDQKEQKSDQHEKQQEQKQRQKQQQEGVQRKSEPDQKQQRVQEQEQKQKQDQQQRERVQQKSEQDQNLQQQRAQQQQQRQEQEQKQKQNQQQERVQQQQRQDHNQQQKQQQRLSRQQQIHLRDDRLDYDRDPYFYTAPTYRYNRGGKYYETNEYGAKTLRQAVNYGYDEGFRAGQADRKDHWRSNYKDSYAYRDANYGYSGYYIDRSDYNYYFREGFRRGYEDGYNSRYQYGRFSGGNYSILDTILSQILNFQALR